LPRDLIAVGFSFVCVAGVVAVVVVVGTFGAGALGVGFASIRSCKYLLRKHERFVSPGAPINQLAIVQNARFFPCLNTNADAE